MISAALRQWPEGNCLASGVEVLNGAGSSGARFDRLAEKVEVVSGTGWCGGDGLRSWQFDLEKPFLFVEVHDEIGGG